MKRLARLTLVFAILLLMFTIGVTFLSGQFGPYPLMKLQDVADLFTPLILIPIYWLLFEIAPDKAPRRAETIIFLVLAALWVEGQGMHLASNSVDNLLQGKGPAEIVAAIQTLGVAITGSGVGVLTYFYDEVLSHYLWHAAMMALAALLMYRQWRNPFSEGAGGFGYPVGAGVLYGVSHGLVALEGETLPIAIPFSVLVVIFAVVWGRTQFRRQPLMTFFTVAFGVALLVFLAWWLAWGCFASPFDAVRAVFKGLRPACP